MSHKVLSELLVHALPQQQGSACVPQVLTAEACRQPGSSQQALIGAVEIACPEGRADLGGEDKPMIQSLASRILSSRWRLRSLFRASTTLRVSRIWRPLPLLGVRIRAHCRRPNTAADLKRPGFEIHVLPLETQQLALSEPGRHG